METIETSWGLIYTEPGSIHPPGCQKCSLEVAGLPCGDMYVQEALESKCEFVCGEPIMRRGVDTSRDGTPLRSPRSSA